MMPRAFVGCSAGVLLLAIGCGNPIEPSQVLGDWSGRDAPAHFSYLEFRFERQGSDVVGKACYASDVHLVFTDVPVAVDGRHVSVTTTTGSGLTRTWRGQFDADGRTLEGAWTNTPTTRITLTRGGSYCAFAR
jgi:hypothetical protein